MGTFESIPFLNNDAKRTFAHLILRPGYMMRDYIQRGQHEHYLALPRHGREYSIF